MIAGLPNLTGMMFCYATKKEMDDVYKRITDLKIPEVQVLKAWNPKSSHYPWTLALACKDKTKLDELDNYLVANEIDFGDADTYDGKNRIQAFFGMMLIGKYEPGIVRIVAGECPVNAISPISCQLCQYGHMLECHYPMNCTEAECSHLAKYEME